MIDQSDIRKPSNRVPRFPATDTLMSARDGETGRRGSRERTALGVTSPGAGNPSAFLRAANDRPRRPLRRHRSGSDP